MTEHFEETIRDIASRGSITESALKAYLYPIMSEAIGRGHKEELARMIQLVEGSRMVGEHPHPTMKDGWNQAIDHLLTKLKN